MKTKMNFKVVLEPGETSEYLVKRFMKKFKKTNIMKLILERRAFKTNTTKRKEKETRRKLVLQKLRKEQGLE